ncbi:sarcoplasmic calcium-binding protein-like isoform X2 [Tachypleus tridentatus]|uniref:sarcoplasmic calcium-binding protein-like isoform X2 n=1 Tax=Tachypleus tridentatus TaxID=6853 RepID=UPI003FD471D9
MEPFEWSNRVHFIVTYMYDTDNNGYLDVCDFECLALDGQVTVEEFKQAVQNVCVGKTFDSFPDSLKYAITSKFNTTDVNNDGLITVEEYRLEYVSRSAISNITEIDECFEKLLTVDDRRVGGINLCRYQELFAEFIGSPEPKVPGVYLFGPLPVFG